MGMNKTPVVSSEPANPLMAELLKKKNLKKADRSAPKPKPALNQMETMMMMIKNKDRKKSMKHVDRDAIEAARKSRRKSRSALAQNEIVKKMLERRGKIKL